MQDKLQREDGRENLLELNSFPTEPMKTMKEHRDKKLLAKMLAAQVIDLSCPEDQVKLMYPEKIVVEEKGKKKKNK